MFWFWPVKRLNYFTTLKTVVLFIMSFSRSINKLMNSNEVKIHFNVASKHCLNIDLRPFFKFNLLVLPWHTYAKRLSHMNVINISRKRTPMILLPRVTRTLILFRCDYYPMLHITVFYVCNKRLHTWEFFEYIVGC